MHEEHAKQSNELKTQHEKEVETFQIKLKELEQASEQKIVELQKLLTASKQEQSSAGDTLREQLTAATELAENQKTRIHDITERSKKYEADTKAFIGDLLDEKKAIEDSLRSDLQRKDTETSDKISQLTAQLATSEAKVKDLQASLENSVVLSSSADNEATQQQQILIDSLKSQLTEKENQFSQEIQKLKLEKEEKSHLLAQVAPRLTFPSFLSDFLVGERIVPEANYRDASGITEEY
jgi:adenosyl cobinamide kinase/adenosyl cobinamide phosphate guanylyltransferase